MDTLHIDRRTNKSSKWFELNQITSDQILAIVLLSNQVALAKKKQNISPEGASS